MTTQSEVANAFFDNEDGPRRASNFEMVHANGTSYLVGADWAVFAVRRPIRMFTVYHDWARYHSFGDSRSYQADINVNALRRQGRLVSRRAPGDNEREYADPFADQLPDPSHPIVTDFEDLQDGTEQPGDTAGRRDMAIP